MRLLVVGAGQMGGGIAHVAALAGDVVTLLDRDVTVVERGLATIHKNLERGIEKGRLTAATARPARVIGMHYMNPVPVMALVEIIRGIATSPETFETIRALAIAHGKTPVEVRNYPGFVSNRILCPMLNEAIFALFEGVGTVEAIDTVMKLGMNHPMGPLELADFIGLDTLAAILDVLYDGLGDSKYRACPLLREYVAAGWLGRKSGLGFYDWRGPARTQRTDLGPSGVPAFA